MYSFGNLKLTHRYKKKVQNSLELYSNRYQGTLTFFEVNELSKQDDSSMCFHNYSFQNKL